MTDRLRILDEDAVAKRVLVCGSREGWTCSDYQDLVARIWQLPQDAIVIHGDCRGPDRVAGELAAAIGLRVLKHPADWVTHGKSAGYVRNVEMLEAHNPDLVIAMWNGLSRGTKHTMDEAEKRGIPVEVIP